MLLTLGAPDASPTPTNTIASFGIVADTSVDNEQYRWNYLYNRTDDEWRLVSSTVAANGQVTVARAFTNVLTAKQCDLYRTLSPTDWNNVINDLVLPDLYYLDRGVITLTAGTAEYNCTATLSWLTDKGQVIRMRYRDTSDANVPKEVEVPVAYLQQKGDGVVFVHIPFASFPAGSNLLIEARRYYTALSADSNSVSAPEKLVLSVLKHEALKQVFQALGPSAKRIFGMAIVMAERERQEQEGKWLARTPQREWSTEEDVSIGDPSSAWQWGW